MTPDEHAVEAERLLGIAREIYDQAVLEAVPPIDPTAHAEIQSIAALAQVYATLSLRRPALSVLPAGRGAETPLPHLGIPMPEDRDGRPRHVPSNEVVDFPDER